MLKARNMLLIIALNYVLLIVISGVMEIQALAVKSREVQALMRTAGDMSLEQVQLVDDFMAYEGREAYKMNMTSKNGDGFVFNDLFAGVMGLDATQTANRDQIYNKLYQTSEFNAFIPSTNAMRLPVKYYNSTKTAMQWYYMSRAAMLGADIIPPGSDVGYVNDINNNPLTSGFSEMMYADYKFDSHIRVSDDMEYYNTPLNVGITYLDRDLLGSIFINNVDLVMRSKYKDNLNTPEGGDGILRGSTYADRLHGSLDEFNPVNNGLFSVLRGSEAPSTGNGQMYMGVKPDIDYRVIDMYDSVNDPLLIDLFGANKEGMSTKAEYLYNLDIATLNPMTNQPYTRKVIVVAKVTFYMDVVVPYFSIIMRDLQSTVGDSGSSNFIELEPTIKEGSGGTRRVEYTRYFAVTP